MLNIDPNKYANQRKRSSLKKHLFPEGMSYDEYMSQKNKKLQWDNKVEEIEIVKAEGDDLNKLQESNNPELGVRIPLFTARMWERICISIKFT